MARPSMARLSIQSRSLALPRVPATPLQLGRWLARSDVARWAVAMAITCAVPLAPEGGAQVQFDKLADFGSPPSGSSPLGGVIEAADGRLYGTTGGGDAQGYMSAIWSSARDGSDLTVLYRLTLSEGNGVSRELCEGGDGFLYGAAERGGALGLGSLFRVAMDGSSFSVLHDFTGAEGRSPQCRLLLGSDGELYGTAESGGSGGFGTAYTLARDGSGFTVLHDFTAPATGTRPNAGVIEASDGALYGTTRFGGTNGAGMVYSIARDGSGYTIVHKWNGANGAWPAAELLQGLDGSLYGATEFGGAVDEGTVFRVDLDGSNFQMLHSFDLFVDGRWSVRGLCQAPDGTLFGATTQSALGTGFVYRIGDDGSGFAVVHDFDDSSAEDGEYTKSALLLASDGLLYGAAERGGAASDGTCFRMATDGSLFEVLHAFDGDLDFRPSSRPAGALHLLADGSLLGTASGGDGSAGVVFRHDVAGAPPTSLVELTAAQGVQLRSRLLQASDGLLYGTAKSGGTFGGGTLYRFAEDGSSFEVVVEFDGASGEAPNGVLVEGGDGALYGTASDAGAFGWGTLFKVNKDGSGYSVLLDFAAATVGGEPNAGLLLGSDGRLYGSTRTGGPLFNGGLFAIATDGSGFVSLHDFTSAEPWSPRDALIEGSDGRLYGTASGFNGTGSGALFAMQKDGSGFVVLKHLPFTFGTNVDGYAPNASLLEAADGALYGTASLGGTYGEGTLFRIEIDGSDFEVLAEFDGAGHGARPQAALIQAPDGLLYGATEWGGEFGVGALFRVDLGCTATWRNYGTGFPGTLGVPTLVAQAPPLLGATLDVDLGSSATVSTLAFVLIGEDTASLPMRKGGELLVEALIILPMSIAPGTTTLSDDMPNDPALCGVRFYVQALLLDSGAARGLASTPGLELRLGL